MGQLVQGVVVSVDKKRGTVGLKASPSLVASTIVCLTLLPIDTEPVYPSTFCFSGFLYYVHNAVVDSKCSGYWSFRLLVLDFMAG
jgi:hypothetical protein